MRSMAAMAAAMAATAVVAACGGGSTGAAPSKSAWMDAHGRAMATLSADLEAARTTLSSLQRPDILGSCNQLRDSVAEARRGLPVPEPTVHTALTNGLDAVAVGTEDCIQGARGPNIPQLEKSFSELREAHTLLEVADRAIADWR